MEFQDQIKNAVALVRKMLQEQDSLDDDSIYKPSPIWKEVVSLVNYVFNLSAEDFLQIRYHCDLFTGRDLIRYLHPWPPIDVCTDKRAAMYRLCTKGLPESFHLGEPGNAHLPFTPGFEVDGNIINGSIVRFQFCANYLYKSGIASAIQSSSKRKSIIEIGSGHGGLAHSLSSAFSKKISYIMVDLPQMLLFQIPFILTSNPGCTYYIYNSSDFTDDFIENRLEDYDFVFLPNYVINRLRKLNNPALLINIISFQEMNKEQVDDYLCFARDCCEYGVYSDNYDCHPNNTSKDFSVTNMLEKYFKLSPRPEDFWDKISPRARIDNYSQFRRFIALNPQAVGVLNPEFNNESIDLENVVINIFK